MNSVQSGGLRGCPYRHSLCSKLKQLAQSFKSGIHQVVTLGMEAQHSPQVSSSSTTNERWDVRAEAAAYSWLNEVPFAHSILIAQSPLLPTRQLTRVKSTRTDYLHIEYETTSADVAGYYYRIRWHTPTAHDENSNGPQFVIERSTTRSFADQQILAVFSDDQYSKYCAALADPGLSSEQRHCFRLVDRPNARDLEKLLKGECNIHCWISGQAKGVLDKIQAGDTAEFRVSVPLLRAIHHDAKPNKENFEWLAEQLKAQQTVEVGVETKIKSLGVLATECRKRGLPNLRAVFETVVKLDQGSAITAGAASQSVLDLAREAAPDYRKLFGYASQLAPSLTLDLFARFLTAGGIDKKGELLSKTITSLAKISPMHAYECLMLALRSNSLDSAIRANAIRCIPQLPVSLAQAEGALREAYHSIPHGDDRHHSTQAYQFVKQKLEAAKAQNVYSETAESHVEGALDKHTLPHRRLLVSLMMLGATGAGTVALATRWWTPDQDAPAVSKSFEPDKAGEQAVLIAPIDKVVSPVLPATRVPVYTLSPIDEEMLAKCGVEFGKKVGILRDAIERLASLDGITEAQRIYLNELVKDAIESTPTTSVAISEQQPALDRSTPTWILRHDYWYNLVQIAVEDPVANFAILNSVVTRCPPETDPRDYGAVRTFPGEWSLFRTLEGLTGPRFTRPEFTLQGNQLLERPIVTAVQARVRDFAANLLGFSQKAESLFGDYKVCLAELNRCMKDERIFESVLFKEIYGALCSMEQRDLAAQRNDFNGLISHLSFVVTTAIRAAGITSSEIAAQHDFARALLTLRGIELLWPMLGDARFASASNDNSSAKLMDNIELPFKMESLVTLAKAAPSRNKFYLNVRDAIRKNTRFIENEKLPRRRVGVGEALGEEDATPAIPYFDPKTGRALGWPQGPRGAGFNNELNKPESKRGQQIGSSDTSMSYLYAVVSRMLGALSRL